MQRSPTPPADRPEPASRELGERWLSLEETYESELYDGGADPVRLLAARSQPGLVVVAPHSVNHLRGDEVKLADRGTGGLAELLSHLLECSALTAARGPLADAAWSVAHPLKDAIRALRPRPQFLLDVHGMRDQRGLDAEIGLGRRPTGTSVAWARHLSLGLRELGFATVLHERYTAPRPTTLTNWAHTVGFRAAIQLEIAARARPPHGTFERIGRLASALRDLLGPETLRSVP